MVWLIGGGATVRVNSSIRHFLTSPHHYSILTSQERCKTGKIGITDLIFVEEETETLIGQGICLRSHSAWQDCAMNLGLLTPGQVAFYNARLPERKELNLL